MIFVIKIIVVVVAVVVVAVLVGFISFSSGAPSSDQIVAIKEWLKYAVTVAEKRLGSGTGQLKLRYVYNLFATRFSAVAAYISFYDFSSWVDDALEWLENQLSSNSAVSALVYGSTTDTEADDAEALTEAELEAMTVAELKEYAAEKEISLSGLKKKADIIAAILVAAERQQNAEV